MRKPGIIITIILVLGALFLIASLVRKNKADVASDSTITSYEECIAAGNPSQESFPPRCTTKDGKVFIQTQESPQTQNKTTVKGNADIISVTSPTQNQTITSGFKATGKARGNWYFEASFPITLYDANNKVLAQTYAQAQGEWMTTEYVSFISQAIIFSQPTTTTGTLVLQKDNPSDEAKFDDEIRIPVTFGNKSQTVKLYFYDEQKDKDAKGNILCSAKGLVAVNRSIPTTTTPIQDTIRLLLKGELSTAEKNNGLSTGFPLSGVILTGASNNNGVLRLSMQDPNNATSGGACKISILRAQIEATAKQFAGVNSITFSPESLFQP